jgi:hypothetical protein
MTDTDRAEQRRALEQFANASGQPNQPLPTGHALVRPTQSITPLGAQNVARVRPLDGEIKRRIAERAASAGERWFYRFPVKRKDGGTDWIEGPSVKAAMSVLMLYGNAVVEVRELDVGDAWVFYARFTDFESGASIERSYRQHKGQVSIKAKDPQRALDLVYQIGQSKAERNVICNALEHLTDFAFEQAQSSLVSKIGQDLNGWRSRTLDGLARMPVEQHRVERVVGRAAKDWLAPDIALVVALMRGVADGMATIDETFPPDQTIIEKEKAPPAESLAKEPAAVPASPAVVTAESAEGGKSEGGKSGSEVTPPAASPAAPKNLSPKNFAEYMQLAEATCLEATDADTLMKWFRSEPQRRLRNACGLVAEETAQVRELVEASVKVLNTQG